MTLIAADYISVLEREDLKTGVVLSVPGLDTQLNSNEFNNWLQWSFASGTGLSDAQIVETPLFCGIDFAYENRTMIQEILKTNHGLDLIIEKICKLSQASLGSSGFVLKYEVDPDSLDGTLILSVKTSLAPEEAVRVMGNIDKKMFTETNISKYQNFLYTVEY